MVRSSVFAFLGLVVLLGCALPVAHGQAPPSAENTVPSDPEPARRQAQTLFERGVRASDEGRWSDALEAFTASYAALRTPASLLNVALARYRLNQGVAAMHALEELAAMNPPESVRVRAQSLRALVEPLVATCRVHLDPPQAQLHVNEQLDAGKGPERKRVLPPGTHEIRADAEGFLPRSMSANLAGGSVTDLTIHLTPEPHPAASAPLQVTSMAPSSEPSQIARDDAPTKTTPRAWFKNPWLWASVGAIVIAGGTATVLLVQPSSAKEDPAGGSTGRVY